MNIYEKYIQEEHNIKLIKKYIERKRNLLLFVILEFPF